MIKKGTVSSVDSVNKKARVTFPDMDNTVTSEIPYADGLTLSANDTVAVAFFSGNMADGLVFATF